MVLTLLLGCVGTEGNTATFVEDDSYGGPTKLVEVSATCHAGNVLVRGRTLGWMEEAQVEAWGPKGSHQYALEMLTSVAFTDDQRCDIFEGELDPGAGFGCADLESTTFLVRVQYEIGCGGLLVWGPLDGEVLDEDVDPPPGKADCDLDKDKDEGYDPDDYQEAIVVDEIDDCGVPTIGAAPEPIDTGAR